MADFFPVTLLVGVSKFLFSALALAFCLSLVASFVVAMTVIPLFCSTFLKGFHHEQHAPTGGFSAWFNRMFNAVPDLYERCVRWALKRLGLAVAALVGIFLASVAIYLYLGRAFFLQTDASQFTMTDGDAIGNGRRTIYTDGAGDHRRSDIVRDFDGIHRSGRVPAGLWEKETQCFSEFVIWHF